MVTKQFGMTGFEPWITGVRSIYSVYYTTGGSIACKGLKDYCYSNLEKNNLVTHKYCHLAILML